uniref:Uncharacterized protein n=1 Tax=Brassica oleracea var. oleracea TaxID=109376 RepID=A0A0D3E2W5_BRAOL
MSFSSQALFRVDGLVVLSFGSTVGLFFSSLLPLPTPQNLNIQGDGVARERQQNECFTSTDGLFFCFSLVSIVPLTASIISSPTLLHISAHMTLKNRVHEGKNKGLGARWELAKDELATKDQQDWQKE